MRITHFAKNNRVHPFILSPPQRVHFLWAHSRFSLWQRICCFGTHVFSTFTVTRVWPDQRSLGESSPCHLHPPCFQEALSPCRDRNMKQGLSDRSVISLTIWSFGQYWGYKLGLSCFLQRLLITPRKSHFVTSSLCVCVSVGVCVCVCVFVCVSVCVFVYVCVCVVTMLSHSVVSDSLQLHLAHQDPCPWNFLGKNSGVGCHSLLQGNLPTPGMDPGSRMSPALAGGFSTTAPPGKPFFKPIKQMDLTYLIITSGARKILIHCHVGKSRKYNSSMQYQTLKT